MFLDVCVMVHILLINSYTSIIQKRNGSVITPLISVKFILLNKMFLNWTAVHWMRVS